MRNNCSGRVFKRYFKFSAETFTSFSRVWIFWNAGLPLVNTYISISNWPRSPTRISMIICHIPLPIGNARSSIKYNKILKLVFKTFCIFLIKIKNIVYGLEITDRLVFDNYYDKKKELFICLIFCLLFFDYFCFASILC